VPAIQSYFIEPISRSSFCALLPEREVNHSLGCHRSRVPDQVVFERLLQVLVFGCAYWRIADESCSDTTLRRRRDEWIALGMMDALRELVLEAYDRIIGLELADVAVDGCITKALAAARRRAEAFSVVHTPHSPGPTPTGVPAEIGYTRLVSRLPSEYLPDVRYLTASPEPIGPGLSGRNGHLAYVLPVGR
jgi:hypothetical protein